MVEAARRLSTEVEVDHLVAVVGAGETVEGEAGRRSLPVGGAAGCRSLPVGGEAGGHGALA